MAGLALARRLLLFHLDRLRLVNGDNALAVEGKGDFAALQLQGRFAEKLPALALHGCNVGIVAGGDLFQILDGRDHLGGNALGLADEFQEHLQQVDGCSRSVGRHAALGNLRKLVPGDGQRTLDRTENIFRRPRALEAARDRAQRGQRLGVYRLLRGDFIDRVVLDHPVARNVAAVRLALAPGGDEDLELAPPDDEGLGAILDASRDPDEQFLVELGGGPHPARIEVRFPTALDERLVRRRLAKLAAARKNEHLWRSRAWLATAPVLAPLHQSPHLALPPGLAAVCLKESRYRPSFSYPS